MFEDIKSKIESLCKELSTDNKIYYLYEVLSIFLRLDPNNKLPNSNAYRHSFLGPNKQFQCNGFVIFGNPLVISQINEPSDFYIVFMPANAPQDKFYKEISDKIVYIFLEFTPELDKLASLYTASSILESEAKTTQEKEIYSNVKNASQKQLLSYLQSKFPTVNVYNGFEFLKIRIHLTKALNGVYKNTNINPRRVIDYLELIVGYSFFNYFTSAQSNSVNISNTGSIGNAPNISNMGNMGNVANTNSTENKIPVYQQPNAHPEVQTPKQKEETSTPVKEKIKLDRNNVESLFITCKKKKTIFADGKVLFKSFSNFDIPWVLLFTFGSLFVLTYVYGNAKEMESDLPDTMLYAGLIMLVISMVLKQLVKSYVVFDYQNTSVYSQVLFGSMKISNGKTIKFDSIQEVSVNHNKPNVNMSNSLVLIMGYIYTKVLHMKYKADPSDSAVTLLLKDGKLSYFTPFSMEPGYHENCINIAKSISEALAIPYYPTEQDEKIAVKKVGPKVSLSKTKFNAKALF